MAGNVRKYQPAHCINNNRIVRWVNNCTTRLKAQSVNFSQYQSEVHPHPKLRKSTTKYTVINQQCTLTCNTNCGLYSLYLEKGCDLLNVCHKPAFKILQIAKSDKVWAFGPTNYPQDPPKPPSVLWKAIKDLRKFHKDWINLFMDLTDPIRDQNIYSGKLGKIISDSHVPVQYSQECLKHF